MSPVKTLRESKYCKSHNLARTFIPPNKAFFADRVIISSDWFAYGDFEEVTLLIIPYAHVFFHWDGFDA